MCQDEAGDCGHKNRRGPTSRNKGTDRERHHVRHPHPSLQVHGSEVGREPEEIHVPQEVRVGFPEKGVLEPRRHAEQHSLSMGPGAGGGAGPGVILCSRSSGDHLKL